MPITCEHPGGNGEGSLGRATFFGDRDLALGWEADGIVGTALKITGTVWTAASGIEPAAASSVVNVNGDVDPYAPFKLPHGPSWRSMICHGPAGLADGKRPRHDCFVHYCSTTLFTTSALGESERDFALLGLQ